MEMWDAKCFYVYWLTLVASPLPNLERARFLSPAVFAYPSF